MTPRHRINQVKDENTVGFRSSEKVEQTRINERKKGRINERKKMGWGGWMTRSNPLFSEGDVEVEVFRKQPDI